jgi:hypothetical protein
MTDQPGGHVFRSALTADAPAIARLVNAAYQHYVDRIGILPGPMTDDYAEVIRTQQVIVAERGGVIAGVLVLAVSRIGYVEYDQRQERGFSRVYLRKVL